MVAKAAAAKFTRPHETAYKDKTKPADIRHSNINAAKGKLSISSDSFSKYGERK
jgi:hypothetical protein